MYATEEVIADYFPEKWVRVMADYSADPVWSKDCSNSDLDILPISLGTRIRLSEWALFYEYNDDWEADPSGEFPKELFTKWGWRLAKQVKRELPDWTVVYHQESNGMEFEVSLDD